MSRTDAAVRAIRRPDLVLAVFTAAYGLYRALGVLPERPPHPIVIAILLASCAYLTLHRRRETARAPAGTPARRSRLASDAVFTLASAVALLSWHGSLYVLPPLFFAAATVAAGTVLWDVASNRAGTLGTAVMLGKVILIGLLVRGAAYVQFPGPIGSDPWQHVLITQTVAATGHVARRLPDALGTYNLYASIPDFHVLTASILQVADVSAKAASFLGGSVPQVLSCLSVFLLGRTLRGAGAGALAALLYCLADYALLWGVQVIAMTLASAIVACLLWLLLSGRAASASSAGVALLLLASLVLCHTVSAFVMLVVLLVVTVGRRVLRVSGLGRSTQSTTPLLTPAIVGAYGAFMLIWWMVMPTSSGASFFAVQAEKLAQVLATAGESQAAILPSAVPQPYAVTMLNFAGAATLVGLGLYATLVALDPTRQESRLLPVALAAAALLAIEAFGSSSVQEALIGARWVVFQYLALSVLSAWGVVRLLAVMPPRARTGLATALCLVYVVPMLANSTSNLSSPVWPVASHRMGYMLSEQTAWRTQLTRLGASPVSDGYYTGAMATLTSAMEYEQLTPERGEAFIERRNYLARPDLNEGYQAVIGDMREAHMGYYRLQGRPVFVTEYAAGLALTGGVLYANDTTRIVQVRA